MNYVSDKSKFKPVAHFAALVFDSIFIPGDERSRTNPGHGYPDEHKAIVEYITFDSRGEMEKWVTRAESSRHSHKDYQIIEVRPLTVTASVAVEITTPFD